MNIGDTVENSEAGATLPGTAVRLRSLSAYSERHSVRLQSKGTLLRVTGVTVVRGVPGRLASPIRVICAQ